MQEIYYAIIGITLSVIYIFYVIIERLLIRYYRKKIPLIIHVNGIRGKSTTTRLIDAGLRNCGYKVFSKTTGTIPTIINSNNQDIVIKRLGKANIREQIRMLKKAAKENVDVLVLECMAVNPELQKICEEKILNANITIITNVRMDHIKDMGDTLEELALALANTTPTNGTLIVNESEFVKLFTKQANKRNSSLVVAKPYEGIEDLDTFKDNIAIALEVARTLKLDENKFFEGMKLYHKDVGAYSEYKKDNTIFLNGFSINDPDSIKIAYEKVVEKYDKNDITILLNSRSDRPTRVSQHIEMLNSLKCKKIILMGSATSYLYKKIKQSIDVDIQIYKDINSLSDEKIIFAVGNIGGDGMKLVDYYKKEGEKVC